MTTDVELMTAAVETEPLSLVARAALADALAADRGDPTGTQDMARMVALRVRIAAFVAHLDEVMAKHWADHAFSFAPPPLHIAEFRAKWCLVVRRDRTAEGGLSHRGSATAFIALDDFETRELGAVVAGNIHKPASYKKPAKHARGSVWADDFGDCIGPGGHVKYLR